MHVADSAFDVILTDFTYDKQQVLSNVTHTEQNSSTLLFSCCSFETPLDGGIAIPSNIRQTGDRFKQK